MTDAPIELERRGARADVALVTLHRPDRLNAIDADLADAMHETFLGLALDNTYRAVVLRGAGRAFCAGGDLRAMRDENPERPGHSFYEVAGRFHEAIMELRTMSRGVVCALEGPAAGGGLSLALACDLRVMARGAFLKVGYVANGLSLDGGGSHALPRLVGLSRATELALLDEPVDAQRSLELGLVHRLADDDDCLDTAIALADRLASMPLGSIGRTKRLFVRAFDNSLERHLDEERRAIAAAADSLEGREGVGAFLDKREPDYRRAIEEDEPEV